MTTALLVVLAVAVVTPVALVVLRRPQRGVLVLAALLPFDGLLLIIPHPGLVNGWKEGLVLAVLAATFIAPDSARGADGRTLPSWLLPAGGWLLLTLASAAIVGGEQGLQGVKIGFFYLLLFWAIWRCPLDRVERDRLVTVLMTTGVVTAAWGVAQQVIGADTLVSWGYQYNTTVRTNGSLMRSFSTFEQPFPFGLFVAMVILVGLAVALADPRRRRNTLFLVATPVLVAGLLSSTVRSAVVGLAVGLLALALQRHRGLLHAVPFAALGVLLVPVAVLDAFTASDSLTERTTGWDDMVTTILSSPFGTGVASTGSAAEKTTLEGGATTNLLTTTQWAAGYQPDNYYVKTLVELGPLGLWMVVLLLVAVLVSAWTMARGRRGDDPDGAVARGIAAVIASVMAASLAATYFEIFPLDAYFWLLLGLLATLPGGEDPPATGATPHGATRADEPSSPAVAAGATRAP